MIRNNLFITLKDGEDKLTIIPFELELDIAHKLKRGVGSRFGHTQELKS
jgi:hypothetical protein